MLHDRTGLAGESLKIYKQEREAERVAHRGYSAGRVKSTDVKNVQVKKNKKT